MTQSKLAAAAGLGLSTIVDFEKERRLVSDDAVAAMQSALERAGIAFKGRDAGIAVTELRSGFSEPANRFNEKAHVGSKFKKTGLLSSAQIRAARALLRWSATDLARESALGVNTIRRAEAAQEGTSLTAANELAVRGALEAAGVVFIDENGGGCGVRLRKRR